MRFLVTGAAGFLGGALARQLAASGHQVRGLVRPGREARALETAGVEVAAGDLRDEAAVGAAVRGCSHVLHLAAQRSWPGVPRTEVQAANVEGTRVVMERAQHAGVRRLVFASTLGVHGFVTRRCLDESSSARPSTAYRLSKWHAETMVRKAHGPGGMETVVARIATVVGPGARSLLAFTRAVDTQRFRLIGMGANHIDLVSVDDIVDGLWRCATVPAAAGKVYVLGGAEEWAIARFAATLARALARPAPVPGLPAWPYRALLQVDAFRFRLTGRHSAWAHGREMLVADKRSSSAKARADLGYAPSRSVERALIEMVLSFRANGLLSGGAIP